MSTNTNLESEAVFPEKVSVKVVCTTAQEAAMLVKYTGHTEWVSSFMQLLMEDQPLEFDKVLGYPEYLFLEKVVEFIKSKVFGLGELHTHLRGPDMFTTVPA